MIQSQVWGIVAQNVRSLFVILAPHLGALVQVPAAPLPVWLSANAAGKAAGPGTSL